MRSFNITLPTNHEQTDLHGERLDNYRNNLPRICPHPASKVGKQAQTSARRHKGINFGEG
jgi:hypothetical protein